MTPKKKKQPRLQLSFQPTTWSNLSPQLRVIHSTLKFWLHPTFQYTTTSHLQPTLFDCKTLTCSSTTDSVSKHGSMQPWTVLAMMHLHHSPHTLCRPVRLPSITKGCSLTSCAAHSLQQEQRTSTCWQSRCTSQMKSTAITLHTTLPCLRTTTTMTTIITVMMTQEAIQMMVTMSMAMMSTTMEVMMAMTTAITT